MSDDLLALAALRGCAAQLRAAYSDANDAANHLAGAAPPEQPSWPTRRLTRWLTASGCFSSASQTLATKS